MKKKSKAEENSYTGPLMAKAEKQSIDQQPIAEIHYVYIVACGNGSLYTGYAKNVQRRVATHNAGKGGRYTRSHLPVTLLATWSFSSKSEALRAEYKFKRCSRAQKLRLVENSLSQLNMAHGHVSI